MPPAHTERQRLRAGTRHSLIIFIGEAERRLPPELSFEEGAREAEAAALASVVTMVERHAEAETALCVAQYDSLRAAGSEVVGAAIERVVQRYGAPHLRPSSILERAQAGHAAAARSSLRALLRYAASEQQLGAIEV